uniref:Uncharacterized protein n=1 Tax=Tanacetum cinerariifolium TaxID=118510 RepID=A0A6L2KPZ0_TANCI|nr:hypothetical protein [Tanacetum cinerariifolium]
MRKTAMGTSKKNPLGYPLNSNSKACPASLIFPRQNTAVDGTIEVNGSSTDNGPLEHAVCDVQQLYSSYCAGQKRKQVENQTRRNIHIFRARSRSGHRCGKKHFIDNDLGTYDFDTEATETKENVYLEKAQLLLAEKVLRRLSELKKTIDVGLLHRGNSMKTIGKQYEQRNDLIKMVQVPATINNSQVATKKSDLTPCSAGTTCSIDANTYNCRSERGDKSVVDVIRPRRRKSKASSCSVSTTCWTNISFLPYWDDLMDNEEAIETFPEVYGDEFEEFDLLVGMADEKKTKGFANNKTTSIICFSMTPSDELLWCGGEQFGEATSDVASWARCHMLLVPDNGLNIGQTCPTIGSSRPCNVHKDNGPVEKNLAKDVCCKTSCKVDVVESGLGRFSNGCGDVLKAASRLKFGWPGLSFLPKSLQSGAKMCASGLKQESFTGNCFLLNKNGISKSLFISEIRGKKTFSDIRRYDEVIEASSISNFDVFFFTGSVCLKSPPNIMLLPPNGVCGLSNMSLRHRSRASKQRRSFIGASSQMMRSVSLNKSASWLFFYTASAFFVQVSGILNREWAVLPDGKSNDAIPEDATAKTILSCKRRMHAIDF